MIEKVYSKLKQDIILHLIFRLEDNNKESNRQDIVDADNFLQCSYLKMPKNKTFKPHKHIFKNRQYDNQIAQESWVVIRGSVKCVLCEPDFVCPEVRQWLSKNKHLFSDIIELNTGFDFTGEVWIEDKQVYPKTKNISAIFSNKFIKGVKGYELRREISSKMKNEIELYGAIPGGKIACGSIPIYWASKENPALRYYDPNGMFLFETIEELKEIIHNQATEENYFKMLPYVQENFKKLLKVNWNFVILEYCGFKKFLKIGVNNE